MSPKSRRPPPEDVEQTLERFTREFPKATLIGGWATYLHTGVAKSHDIDAIVDHETLSKLKTKYRLSESTHVGGRKYQIDLDGVEVDLYPAFQSRLGRRLQVPVEVLAKRFEEKGHARILTREALFVAKMAALLDRPDSLPGEKDRSELWSLYKGLNLDEVRRILGEAGKSPAEQVELLSETLDLLTETRGLSGSQREQLRADRRRLLQTSE